MNKEHLSWRLARAYDLLVGNWSINNLSFIRKQLCPLHLIRHRSLDLLQASARRHLRRVLNVLHVSRKWRERRTKLRASVVFYLFVRKCITHRSSCWECRMHCRSTCWQRQITNSFSDGITSFNSRVSIRYCRDA